MKCDFCFEEKAVIHIGYGECACKECRDKYLEQVSGGWRFRDDAPDPPAMKTDFTKPKQLDPGFC